MKFYTCKYCYSEFKPIRRNIQKYCSNTCRSKAHHQKMKNKTIAPNTSLNLENGNELKENISNKTKIDSMSMSGIGNAATGALLANSLQKLLTPNNSKAASKGDIEDLKSFLRQRYFIIKNMPLNHLGQTPHFDIQTQNIIYMTCFKN
jgi:hypothetical protein